MFVKLDQQFPQSEDFFKIVGPESLDALEDYRPNPPLFAPVRS
jgi:hypothetical protein